MNLPKEELEKFSLEDKAVSKYMDKLNRISEDSVFLNLIDYEEDNKRLINSMKREAIEARFEAGVKTGIEKEKKEARKEKMNIALELLKINMSIQEITKITGLKEEKILDMK